MKMIKINKGCIGCGNCVSICPSVFEIKEGLAIIKSQESNPNINEAILSCPINCIIK